MAFNDIFGSKDDLAIPVNAFLDLISSEAILMAKLFKFTLVKNCALSNSFLDLIFSNFKSFGSLPTISLKSLILSAKFISELIIAILAALILVFARATSVFDKMPASNSASAELYLFFIAV